MGWKTVRLCGRQNDETDFIYYGGQRYMCQEASARRMTAKPEKLIQKIAVNQKPRRQDIQNDNKI